MTTKHLMTTKPLIATKPLMATITCGLLCCAMAAVAGCNRKPSGSTSTVASAPAASAPDPSKPESPVAATDEPTPVLPTENRQPVAAAEPEPDLAAVRAAGLQALQRKQTDIAYQYARQAMRLDADDPQVIFLMAMVLAERHRFPEAIEMLEDVAATTPQARLPALGQTADWLVRYGDWTKAEARYLELLDHVPESALVHRNLARLLLRQGRRLAALEHLNQLCQLGDVTEMELRSMLAMAHSIVGDVDAKSLEPIGMLGTARVEVGQGDWQAVRDRLESADTRSPDESALLGRTYAVLGDLESLQVWIEQADQSVNVSPDAWYAKGHHAAAHDQHAEATRCFAETIRRDPTDRSAYAQLAQSLDATESTTEADAARQRAALIEATQQIGIEMAKSLDRDQTSIMKLSDLLRQLRRPLEALGWRGVWLTYANDSRAISQQQAEQVLEEIAQERQSLLAAGQATSPEEFVLCGVQLETLPSLDEIDQRLKTLPH